jgi:hypothetical protein
MNINACAKSFPLGQIVITAKAQDCLDLEDVYEALARHVRGDWGDCDPEDAARNDRALHDGGRLMSIYHDRHGQPFWILTEAARDGTTILLPEDY